MPTTAEAGIILGGEGAAGLAQQGEHSNQTICWERRGEVGKGAEPIKSQAIQTKAQVQ